jgi:hypothetical protein
MRFCSRKGKRESEAGGLRVEAGGEMLNDKGERLRLRLRLRRRSRLEA